MNATRDEVAHAPTEEEEWLNLTPAQRLEESGKLWELFFAMGGSLDPEPDPQSPFYFPETPDQSPVDRRPGGQAPPNSVVTPISCFSLRRRISDCFSLRSKNWMPRGSFFHRYRSRPYEKDTAYTFVAMHLR
jgi:hypothetical protein